ncbi:MAG: polyprenyl synthetase family protein [Rhodothermales bacterium]|nr:polyprenyl synthetase family protein [Rhodothermales bacterium]MBO6780086.1 polyprenyl synthetase family protein [Rhodothermales bacterium]
MQLSIQTENQPAISHTLTTQPEEGRKAVTFSSSAVPSIAEIQQPVRADLDAFRTFFRDAMRTRVRLLDLVIRYVLRRKGKQLRPLLVLLSARATGSVTETTYRGAALVELLHTATLVHDDVVDDSERRRGQWSVNVLWKNKVGVLLGDYLLSRGLLLALDAKDYDLLHTVSDAVRRMSEGELLQLEKARRLDIDEDTYFRIISDKTASLLSACTTCGAVSVTEDADLIDRMRRFGEQLGLAFQIRDDLFDFGVADVGKPLGIDLKEKKMTLPLIHALGKASAGERRRIMRIVRKSRKTDQDVRRVADWVQQQGGLEYARDRMFGFAREALALLEPLPDSPARASLQKLVAFTVLRSH